MSANQIIRLVSQLLKIFCGGSGQHKPNQNQNQHQNQYQNNQHQNNQHQNNQYQNNQGYPGNNYQNQYPPPNQNQNQSWSQVAGGQQNQNNNKYNNNNHGNKPSQGYHGKPSLPSGGIIGPNHPGRYVSQAASTSWQCGIVKRKGGERMILE
jgi:DNA mismatch repair ATPase MutL